MAIFQRELALENKSDIRYALQRMTIKELIQFEDRLRKLGWIDVWRNRNRTTIKYSVYKTSFKCNHMISRIYRILLGEEDIPVSTTNPPF